MNYKEIEHELRLVRSRIRDAEEAQSSMDQFRDCPGGWKLAKGDSIANSNIAIAKALLILANELYPEPVILETSMPGTCETGNTTQAKRELYMGNKEMANFLLKLRSRNEMQINEDEYYLLGEIAARLDRTVRTERTEVI